MGGGLYGLQSDGGWMNRGQQDVMGKGGGGLLKTDCQLAANEEGGEDQVNFSRDKTKLLRPPPPLLITRAIDNCRMGVNV